MNLNNLYYFVIVAEEMNFTKAAERLFISQQAVSLHIKHLENELNVQLFQRKPYLMLTKEGKSFYNIALNILKLQQGFFSEMASRPVETIVEIKLGISFGRSYIYIPKIVSDLKTKLPWVKLRIFEKPSTQFMEQSVLSDEIDFFLGISPIYSTQIETINLSDETLYLIVPRSFISNTVQEYIGRCGRPVVSETEGISLLAFSDCPFVLPSNDNKFRIAFSQYTSLVGFRPNILLESSQLNNGFFMALDGSCITVLPETMFQYQKSHTAPQLMENLVCFEMPDVVSSKIVLAYNKARQLSNIDQSFIEICREMQFE